MHFRGKWRIDKAIHVAKERLGYDGRNWLRIRQIQKWHEFLAAQQPVADILEISPGWNGMWKFIPSRSYSSVDFPSFDICKETLPRKFHIVIADQVLEHVPNPIAAIQNIRQMLEPGGFALIATPFLFRVHAHPGDYHRWTESGLRNLCISGGFQNSAVQTEAWGNAKCVRAHTKGPVHAFGFGKDLTNDPEYPMMVWSFARN